MITKYIVFDLEFTKLLDGNDEDLHIACASSMSSTEISPYLWYSQGANGIAPYMNKSTLFHFVNYLQSMQQAGYIIVTWGGTASDFRILAKEIPEYAKLLVQLCLYHIDIPFCAASHIGMMMGLSAACKGFNVEDKCSNSKDIPEIWKTDKQKVLEHVSTDSALTLLVLQQIISTKSIRWLTQKGTIRVWTPCSLLPVNVCLLMPLPTVPYQIQDSMNPKLTSKWMFDLKDI